MNVFSEVNPSISTLTDQADRHSKQTLEGLTANASAVLVASRRSLETKFLPMPAGTISSSTGGTEFSVNA